MNTNIINFPSGQVRYSPIQYFTNLTTPDGRIIPLGVIAEFWDQDFCILGMLARTSITKPEMSMVGGLARNILINPSKYLSEQFHESWEESWGESVPFLAEKHPYALNFGMVQGHRLAMSLPRKEPGIGDFVTNFLYFHFNELLESTVVGDTPVKMPTKPFIEIEKAA